MFALRGTVLLTSGGTYVTSNSDPATLSVFTLELGSQFSDAVVWPFILLARVVFHASEVADRFELIDSGRSAGEFTQEALTGPERLAENPKIVAGGGTIGDEEVAESEEPDRAETERPSLTGATFRVPARRE